MFVQYPGRGRRSLRRTAGGRPAGWAAAATLPGLLAGCSGSAASWGFASLALVLVAGAAYGVGWLRARQLLQQELRDSRAELRHWVALHEDWVWHTDAQHRLQSWQGPGQVIAATCPLFDELALLQRLQTQQAFSGLALHSSQTQDGSHGWRFSGVPRHDALGRFAGFVGHACPTDADDQQVHDAHALAPALASHAGPALLLQDQGMGWRLTHANPAAELLWPHVEPGSSLDALLPALPPALALALKSEPVAGEVDGWQVMPFGPLPADARGLLLVQAASATPTPALVETTTESENFTFTVSHDLRAPIRVVDGFTRIVKEDYGRLLDRVGNDHLDRVLGAASRMNQMIDALLTLARLSQQPLARQPVNLSQLAGYVIDDLKRSAPEREVDVDIEPGLAAHGDPTLLRLVLENLLGNAWKYTGRSARPQISLRAVAHGNGLAYVVRDNGAGFDMRSSDRLFGLFQRLHSASEFPGHGVGLASVRRIVRRHGGDIWAEAEPGRGAAFYFTLAG